MSVEILRPSCNLATITDGRGGVFTWLPAEPLVEFNLIYLNRGKVRGHHHHPHFTEYLLFVAGTGVLVYKDDDGSTKQVHVSKGVCTRTTPKTSHAVHAIEDLTFVAMLTKRWDECDPPIVPEVAY